MSMGGSASGNTTPAYTSLAIQTAVNTLPVPVIWGTVALAPNLIWANGFKKRSVKQAAGGKGGGNSTGNAYSIAVIMALCEGQIDGIGTVWTNQSTTTLAALNLSLFDGGPMQAVWGFLTTAYPAQARRYPDTAYLASSFYDLGQSNSLPNHTIETVRVSAFAVPNVAHDADPALILIDMLTNARYGCGFPVSSLDLTTILSSAAATTTGDAAYQTYCRALGIALSPNLSSQETASTIVDRWLQLTNSQAVWSANQLKIIPYGDLPVTGNGVTYVPNLTPVYDVDDDDYVPSSDADPVLIGRVDPLDAYNVQRIEVLDRSNAYTAVPIEARDEAMIARNPAGERVADTITAHEICDPINVAPIVVQLILQRGLYIRNTPIKFTLGWEYCLLEPADVITITDPRLGISRMPIRLVDIEESDTGELAITAEELPIGVATAWLYAKQQLTAYAPNVNAAPGSVN